MLSYFFALASLDSDLLYVPGSFVVISNYSVAYPTFPEIEVSPVLDCCFDFPTLQEIDGHWNQDGYLRSQHDFFKQRRDVSYGEYDFYRADFELSDDSVSMIIDSCLRNRVASARDVAKTLFYRCAVDARELFEEVEFNG